MYFCYLEIDLYVVRLCITSYKVYKHTILSMLGASLSKYDGAVGNEKIKKNFFTRPSSGGRFFYQTENAIDEG